MRFVVSSGTDVSESAERYDSASLALEAVLELLAKGCPNIRTFGEIVSLSDLREMATTENESDDA